MRRFLLILVVLVLVMSSITHQAAAYPGSCAPATDLQSCLECASSTYQSCAGACSSSTAWGCHSECIRELNADRNDCHGNFDPLWY